MTASPERIAIVDIGSLRAKLTIFDVSERHNLKYIDRQRSLTNLGRDLARGERSVGQEALADTLQTLRDYRACCASAGVGRIVAIATQAIREAVNQREVLYAFEDVLGTSIEILSKEREADCFFRAVADDCRSLPRVATIEVGGGSVQLAVGTSERIEHKLSVRTGTAVLLKRFTDEATGEENYSALAHYIAQELEQAGVGAFCQDSVKPTALVYGSSCMKDFLCAAGVPVRATGPSANHDLTSEVSELETLYQEIKQIPMPGRGHIFPADPSFMVGADKSLLNVIIAARILGVETIVPSNFSISEGLIVDNLQRTP